MNQEPTPKQKHIYDFIAASIRTHGFCPTLREIGKHCGISVGTAQDQTRALVAKGIMTCRKKGAARAFILAETSPRGIPVLGRVGAGGGILAGDETESYVDLGDISAKTDFMLEVKGDSMDADGILEGDFVQVHRQQVTRDGELVVAVVGEEGVVKRLRTGRSSRLESANKKYSPITEEFMVVGKVVGLVRRYDSTRLGR
jgi:repressor LexA